MFDPNKNPTACVNYLSQHLGCQVGFIQAWKLSKGSRESPWQVEVIENGALKSYVLQFNSRNMTVEYRVLKALEVLPVPTPRVYGLDLKGDALGQPCFFRDFIEGDTLQDPVLAGESWAEGLYVEAVSQLQSVTGKQLGRVASSLKRETAQDVLEDAYDYLKVESIPGVENAYQALKATMPDFPPARFGNGDLWLGNFIVKDRKLVGVIDFPNAMFSDPIYEFLLSFFVCPQLRGRGLEERYCRRMGYDPAILHWYNGLEYFDTLRWVLATGEDFVHHTAKSLEQDLQDWYDLYDSKLP